MPPVIVNINSSTVTVNPPVVITSTNSAIGLTVTWNINNDGSIPLASPPIVFPWPVPSGVTPPPGGFTQYTGAVTQVPGGGDRWQATMPPQPSGVTQFYKYNVAYANGGFYDPEVENQGVPPQPGSGGGGGPKPPKDEDKSDRP